MYRLSNCYLHCIWCYGDQLENLPAYIYATQNQIIFYKQKIRLYVGDSVVLRSLHSLTIPVGICLLTIVHFHFKFTLCSTMFLFPQWKDKNASSSCFCINWCFKNLNFEMMCMTLYQVKCLQSLCTKKLEESP